MNEVLSKFLLSAINENKLPHAFLIETNNFEEVVEEIYNIFLKNGLISKNKIENSSDVMIMTPETILDELDEKRKTKIINKDKILFIQQFLTTMSLSGLYKIYFICNAELMNDAAANKLLKTLEEPGENSIGFLLTLDSGVVFPTIKSRCEFFKLESDLADDVLVNEYVNKIKETISMDYKNIFLLKKELITLEKKMLISILIKLKNDYDFDNCQNAVEIKKFANKCKILDNIIDVLVSNGSIELAVDRLFIELR